MINWSSFSVKYNAREQWAFENMSYFLFCAVEMDSCIGAFSYKDQIGIEAEPIEKNGVCCGFQAKYYTTPISKNKSDIIDSICKAKNKNPQLNKIYLYTNQRFKESTEPNQKKPKYQTDIEAIAKNTGVEIEWRVSSHIEYQLSQPKNKWIREIFFGSNGLDPDFFANQVEREVKNLGARFNEELNLELPIAQIFISVSNNSIYRQNIIEKTDKWLTERTYRRLRDNEHLAEIETELDILRQEIKDWIIGFQNYSIGVEITLLPLIEKVEVFNKKVSDKWRKISDLNYKHREDKKNFRRPFDEELRRLGEIRDANYELISDIDDLNINLANHPTLIIQGEAGCGKSHLLGDIATQRQNQSLPTILLLGTTFNNSNTIEKNILNKLDLTCSFKNFLENLNNIGLQVNSRVLILIDAINEGAGVDLWKNQIAGFVSRVAKYPAIGLVMTIRNTYFNDIIPDDFESNPTITIIKHEGFKGNEYEALKLFCRYYDLKLPNFPILNPEFANPLLLHTTCKAVKNFPEKTFPKGFNGINKIYGLYKKTLNEEFAKKSPVYKYQDVVSKAVEKLSAAIFDTEYQHLNISEAAELLNTEFSRFPLLLLDLIEENVLIKTRSEYDRENPQDIVFFSYQRLGDYFIAEELLKPYSTKEEIKNAFVNDTRFQKITDRYQWTYRGVVEALSILLPERYGIELFELIDFFFDKNTDKRDKKRLIAYTYGSFSRILLDSLKWRELDNINEKKIIKWFQKNSRLSNDEWFYALTELAAITNHPFNSDRLHQILMRYSMSERDGFWQQYVRYYTGYDDNKMAFPLTRLMDWAWLPNISYNADAETVRLVAQTLAWVLSSTDIALRDKTTKALVNLLEQQSEVLIQILTAFENIDDMYIQERLYAVAYGCILRTEKDSSIKIIAQYIYNTIFKNGNPPAHILIRDYARNAVEYGIYKNVGLDIEVELIRPPYNSIMPNLPESKDDVRIYKLDYEIPDFKQNYGFEHNAIYNSLLGFPADFGRYIVESQVDNFASFSFREDEGYRSFLKTVKRNQREFIELFYQCIKQEAAFNEKYDYQIQQRIQWSESQQVYIDILDSAKKLCLNKIDSELSEEQANYVKTIIFPYFERKLNLENFNPYLIKYWIVKRVFELGYDRNLHGVYDSMLPGYNNRHENKIERIGKKYQWIAFYEILAMLTDNYKLRIRWNSDSKYEYYKGAWQLYIRNIDPAYITKDKDEVDENVIKRNSQEWWGEEQYTHWSIPDFEWIKTIEDLISPKQVIEKKDVNGEEWLYLQHFVEWREPKKIGVERYGGRIKQTWYLIQGLLVKKSDKQKIINYLKDKSFWGRWLPENNDNHSNLFNREKFWSPAYLDTYKNNKKIWRTIRDTQHKVIVATESANGNIEGDKSGVNRSYYIPCKYIFEKMSLQYAPIDGNLKNVNDETIVINSNPKGVLMRKKDLIQFLEDNKLDIIWTILGEKMSYESGRREGSYFSVPCGVYYLENGKIEGELKMYDRD